MDPGEHPSPSWARWGLSEQAPLPAAQDTLTEISEWLENHPREVVILACRNFEGMTQDLHEYLVACIRNIFGDMLCPRGVRRAPWAGLVGQDQGGTYLLLGSAVHDSERILVLGRLLVWSS